MLDTKPKSTDTDFMLQRRYGLRFGKSNFPKKYQLDTALSELVVARFIAFILPT